MKFNELFPDSIITSIFGDDVDISEITIDSRRAKPGTCFVALRGTNNDGHDFIQMALDSKVSAVIAEEVPDGISVPYAIVKDTRLALGFIAANYFGTPSGECKVIGVTGTNGKTTTAHIISHILKTNERRSGRVGTTGIFWPGNKIKTPNTTPESIVLQRTIRDMVDDGVSDLCIEVSSHGLETGRLNGLLFDVGIFLNITQDHLDFHGSMDAYFDAKMRLFTEHFLRSWQAGKTPRAVVSIDSEYGLALVEILKKPMLSELRQTSLTFPFFTFGISGGDFHATEIVSDLNGTRFLLRHPEGTARVKTNLIGAFNVSNILASIAACTEVGVSVEDSIQALASKTPINVDGRLERVRDSSNDSGRHVFVDFAHTPDALENVLKTLREIVGEKKIWLVFGAGGDRDRSKRALMGTIALNLADCCVVTNDNPRTENPQDIVDEIVGDKGDKFTILLDRKEAIEFAIRNSERGDVVLIAGKGHETYQETNGVKFEFSDSKIAQEVLVSLPTCKNNVP